MAIDWRLLRKDYHLVRNFDRSLSSFRVFTFFFWWNMLFLLIMLIQRCLDHLSPGIQVLMLMLLGNIKQFTIWSFGVDCGEENTSMIAYMFIQDLISSLHLVIHSSSNFDYSYLWTSLVRSFLHISSQLTYVLFSSRWFLWALRHLLGCPLLLWI